MENTTYSLPENEIFYRKLENIHRPSKKFGNCLI